jgi:hypothetical protein
MTKVKGVPSFPTHQVLAAKTTTDAKEADIIVKDAYVAKPSQPQQSFSLDMIVADVFGFFGNK